MAATKARQDEKRSSNGEMSRGARSIPAAREGVRNTFRVKIASEIRGHADGAWVKGLVELPGWQGSVLPMAGPGRGVEGLHTEDTTDKAVSRVGKDALH